MFGSSSRFPAVLALAGAVLGLVFAVYSTIDYAQHLDRRLHDVHCSFIPGAPATSEAEACRAAMYSPYSALLREQYWGGVPISLFALGAFTFFVGFALYLVVANGRAPKTAVGFFAAVSVTPLFLIVIHVCQPRVLGTVNLPVLSTPSTSMWNVPPVPLDATRTSKSYVPAAATLTV